MVVCPTIGQTKAPEAGPSWRLRRTKKQASGVACLWDEKEMSKGAPILIKESPRLRIPRQFPVKKPANKRFHRLYRNVLSVYQVIVIAPQGGDKRPGEGHCSTTWCAVFRLLFHLFLLGGFLLLLFFFFRQCDCFLSFFDRFSNSFPCWVLTFEILGVHGSII